VEKSLCYGWINSFVKRVDEDTYVQNFMLRKTNRMWSAFNKGAKDD